MEHKNGSCNFNSFDADKQYYRACYFNKESTKKRGKEMQIITENNIDENAAKAYITAENELELLPGIPENLTIIAAAEILSVSEPTISRMLEDGQIQLKKSAILAYLDHNYLANRPLNLPQNTP